MLFKHKQLQGLDRLEAEGNDDFQLLEELGPGQFGTEHLQELKEQVEGKITLFEKRQKLAVFIAACGTGWLFLAILALKLKYIWVALGASCTGGLGIVLFIALILRQKIQFESRGELDYMRQVIEYELRQRKQIAPRNPKKF